MILLLIKYKYVYCFLFTARRTNIKACQQQTNGVDYGVFAVTNMFHILIGTDIGRTKIWEDKVRNYLLPCIKSRHFQEFEKSDSGHIDFCKTEKNKIYIFCYCKFPRSWKTKIWIWHAVIRARNGIIANVKTHQTLFSMKSLIFIWDCISCLNSN